MEHRVESLPKWAQELVSSLRSDLQTAQRELDNQGRAHVVLQSRRWFPIYGPKGPDGEYQNPPRETYKLWMLYPDHPHPVCDLSGRDVLLIGRDMSDWDKQCAEGWREGKTWQGL